MTIPSNKKYDKFWEKDELDISVIQGDNNISNNEVNDDTSIDIKKTVKKTVKKPIKKDFPLDNTETKIEDNINDIIENIKENSYVTVKKTVIINEITLEDVYNNFLAEKEPFRILNKGIEIFNTKKQLKKDYPVFMYDGFVLFGKKYPFRGIRIEKI